MTNDAMLIDTHAHLDQPEFDSDRAEVIRRASEAGVEAIVAVGTSAQTSQKCVDLASQFPTVYAAVGIQPNSVHEAADEDWDRVKRLVSEQKVVALGETGLDRYWDFAPFELQQDYFDRHLRLSQETSLPFIVHMRDCEEDILKMLREARLRGELRGVMHSFTGTESGAAECIELGLTISFAGMVTFKKSEALRVLARSIPPEKILVETDSPYLSPEPVRKIRRNEPAHVRHTAACLGKARGETLEDFSQTTTANARRLFAI